MNNEEIQSLIKQLKAAGLDDEEIMDTFYEAFEKGEMDRKDLEALASAMGYELTDDFKNDAEPDPIEDGDDIDGEKLDKADLEEAKENPENVIDDIPEKDSDEPKKEDLDSDDDDEDWEKAQKMFKI